MSTAWSRLENRHFPAFSGPRPGGVHEGFPKCCGVTLSWGGGGGGGRRVGVVLLRFTLLGGKKVHSCSTKDLEANAPDMQVYEFSLPTLDLMGPLGWLT